MDYEIVQVPAFIYCDVAASDPEASEENGFLASCELCQHYFRPEGYNETYSRMETAGEYCVYPLSGGEVEERSSNFGEEEAHLGSDAKKPGSPNLNCSDLRWALRWYNRQHRLDLPLMCYRFSLNREEYAEGTLAQVGSRPFILPDPQQLIAAYKEHRGREAERWEEIRKKALQAIADVRIPKWAWRVSGKKFPKVEDRQYLYEIRDRWLPLMDLILPDEVEQLVDQCFQGSTKEKEYLCKLLRGEV
jgi:hypothetical protein